jgi:hypothetical protein
MTRLIRRVVLASTAALAVIALHGQTTTAGLLDLDDLSDVVLDNSTAQPDSTPAPATGLLDRTTSNLNPPMIDMVVPLPPVAAPTIPDIGSAPTPTLAPAPAPAVPAPVADDADPAIVPVVGPGGLIEPAPVASPAPAAGDSPTPAPTIGARSAPSAPSAASDPSTGGSPASRGVEREPGSTPPVDTTESWNPAVIGRGGLPTRALGIALGAIAALWIVIAVARRAINRRGQRTDEAVDREREPTGRVAAETRPNRRVPPVRASADVRPDRRAPRSGVGGRAIDRVDRDRRVPRTPSARSTRTSAQSATGARRRSRGSGQPSDRRPVGGRASITPPARRTTG